LVKGVKLDNLNYYLYKEVEEKINNDLTHYLTIRTMGINDEGYNSNIRYIYIYINPERTNLLDTIMVTL